MSQPQFPGMLPTKDWMAYEHEDFPGRCGYSVEYKRNHFIVLNGVVSGFVFVSNPFQASYQRYWAYRCLHDYHEKPSKRNIDAHLNVPDSLNIWDHR